MTAPDMTATVRHWNGFSRTLHALRADGWSVAIHNDYRLDGRSKTFWLMTHPNGRWIKGEGATDMDALMECDAAARALAALPQPAGGRAERREEITKKQIVRILNRHVVATLDQLEKAADAILALPREPGEAWRGIDDAAKEAGSDSDNPLIIGWWSLDREWQWVAAYWTGEEWDAGDNEISHCTPTHWLDPAKLPLPAPPLSEQKRGEPQ